ncbi:MAG: dihydrofolate reductase [Beijerinckiaceae bacterium]
MNAERKIPVIIVAAMAKNRVIGRDNQMPWHLPADLKHFRAVTMGRPMIMGRRTFESIGKPLPGRETIILTRDEAYPVPTGVFRAATLDAALALAAARAAAMEADAIMVVGGGDIYAQALPRADRLELTEIEAAPDGDTYFPAFSPADFRETSREQHGQQGDSPAHAFVRYERIPYPAR